jgi:hypothetical protein
MLRSRAHARGVSKHEGKGIARLILRDGATRLLRMRLPKTAASTALVGPFPVFSCFFANTDLGFTRDRRPNVRKSGKPDLRGPFQSVAVPGSAMHPSLTLALHRVRDTRLQRPDSSLRIHLSNSPTRSRARIAASGLCLFASLTPVEGWAERRETFGCLRDTRWTRRNAACQALARRLASHDAAIYWRK